MIDLHCHILPGIDDGAADLAVSMAMAEAFVAQGVEIVACTPHILPGLYHNSGPAIRAAIAQLQLRLDEAGLPLRLTTGADVHLAPNLATALENGDVLSLGDSRYVLIEPPHHVFPVRFEETLFDLKLAGYVPIVTHPERLSWIRGHYAVLQRLVEHGAWMQVTAGSLLGKFGRSSLYWAERMLDEGMIHVLASDAHDVSKRRPDLAAGAEQAARRVGDDEAREMVLARPKGVLGNVPPGDLSRPRGRGSIGIGGGAVAGNGCSLTGGGGRDERIDGGVSAAVRGFGQRLLGFLQ